MSEVAILGGGHGAYAAAADLVEQGHEVRLWRRDHESFAPVRDSKQITLTDAGGSRAVDLAMASDDIGEVVAGADLIVVPGPAFAQSDIACAIAPHLKAGQVIFLPPGTFGSYAMASEIRAIAGVDDIALAETGTLPYLARKHGPAEIAISVRATRLPTGVFPARLADHALPIIASAYPSVERIEDALSGALMNAGPIIHTPLITMNAGPLEHFDRWDIHNEGTQPSIRRVTTALDGERIAAREALGYGAPHFPLADHYAEDGDEWMYGRQAHAKLTDSGDWRENIDLQAHRYMTEDVFYGLAFLVSVAEWVGASAPIASGLLGMASAIVERDLRRDGRTLENLGLAGLSRDELALLLKNGLN